MIWCLWWNAIEICRNVIINAWLHSLSLLIPFYSLFAVFLLQTDAPRGASQCTSSDCHCKWTHQSVHHDPVAAPTGEPPERPSSGLHHQVGRFSLFKVRCLFEVVVLGCDNTCYVGGFFVSSLPQFCSLQLQNNWCQLKPSSLFIRCHLPFCNNFITVSWLFFIPVLLLHCERNCVLILLSLCIVPVFLYFPRLY